MLRARRPARATNPSVRDPVGRRPYPRPSPPLPSVLDQFPPDVPDQAELVTCEREGDLVRLTLQRPEVMNCLSFPTLRRFRGLLEELAQDLTVRVVLITGSGER